MTVTFGSVIVLSHLVGAAWGYRLARRAVARTDEEKALRIATAVTGQFAALAQTRRAVRPDTLRALVTTAVYKTALQVLAEPCDPVAPRRRPTDADAPS